MNLLSRKINSFNIIITKDKLKIISEIYYLSILDDLEYYLNLTGYLRSFVYYYI